MRITEVKAFLLSSPMPEPILMEYYGGPWSIFRLHDSDKDFAMSGDHVAKWEK